MEDREKQRLIEALRAREAILPCPRCANRDFSLIDGYFLQSIQPEYVVGTVIGGPSIPSIAVVCTRCGFISHHAVGVLVGAAPQQQNEHATENTTENITEESSENASS